jgi:hypothetical protein
MRSRNIMELNKNELKTQTVLAAVVCHRLDPFVIGRS